MHIEVFNEDPTYGAQDATDTVDAVDAADAVDGVNEEALIDVASFALSRMDVHSEAELNIYIVDEDTRAYRRDEPSNGRAHARWAAGCERTRSRDAG